MDIKTPWFLAQMIQYSPDVAVIDEWWLTYLQEALLSVNESDVVDLYQHIYDDLGDVKQIDVCDIRSTICYDHLVRFVSASPAHHIWSVVRKMKFLCDEHHQVKQINKLLVGFSSILSQHSGNSPLIAMLTVFTEEYMNELHFSVMYDISNCVLSITFKNMNHVMYGIIEESPDEIQSICDHYCPDEDRFIYMCHNMCALLKCTTLRCHLEGMLSFQRDMPLELDMAGSLCKELHVILSSMRYVDHSTKGQSQVSTSRLQSLGIYGIPSICPRISTGTFERHPLLRFLSLGSGLTLDEAIVLSENIMQLKCVILFTTVHGEVQCVSIVEQIAQNVVHFANNLEVFVIIHSKRCQTWEQEAINHDIKYSHLISNPSATKIMHNFEASEYMLTGMTDDDDTINLRQCVKNMYALMLEYRGLQVDLWHKCSLNIN